MDKALFAVAFIVVWGVLGGVAEFANFYGRKELQRKTPDPREVAKWYRMRSRFSLPFVLMSLVTAVWLWRMSPDQWVGLLIVFGGATLFGVYSIATTARRLRPYPRKSDWPAGRIFGMPVESPVGQFEKS